MNHCHDDQTESSGIGSGSVQFQSSLKSVSLNSSTVRDAMEENLKIDQPFQKYSPNGRKNILKGSASIAELRDDLSAMKTTISGQQNILKGSASIAELRDELSAMKTTISGLQKRNMALEDVVVRLCDQMRNVIERLPRLSAEEQAIMKAALKNSIDNLSDSDKLKSVAFRVNGPSTLDRADEITHEKVNSSNSLTNSNLTLTDIAPNSSLKNNELGNEILNGDISNQNGQDQCDVAQDEVLETRRIESNETSSNVNGVYVNNSEPLVYHLSEKHGPSGSKTLRINIAPTSKQHHPHIGRLTKSAFSSSFSTLPNATSTQTKKNSKSRYERTNSLQSLCSSASLDDLDWPDTDKILEELEVIKEKSINNLAIESNENKLYADKSETLDGLSNSFNQLRPPDCPAGSGHCDTGTDPKSPLAENPPPHLRSDENNELHSEFEKCGGTVVLVDSFDRQVTNTVLASNKITSDFLCDEHRGCASINVVTKAESNEKCLPIDITNILQCGSGSLQSTSKIQTTEDVPQSNSTPATNSQNASKASSKKRRRARLSETESVSKLVDQTKDLVSENPSAVNELCSNPTKSDTTSPKSNVPIITSRRKSRNKHSSLNTSYTNDGGNIKIQNKNSKIELLNESSTSNSMEERMPLAVEEVSKTSSTSKEVSKITPSVINSNYPPSIVTPECNNASQTLERNNKEPLPNELITISTPLEESEKYHIHSTELTFSPSLGEEIITTKESSITELCTSLSPSVEARCHPSSTENATNNRPLTTTESCKMSSLTNPITEPSSLENELSVETSTDKFSSEVSSKPGISSQSTATDVDVVETIPSTTDVTASGPSLTEVACAASESKGVDAKCRKVSDTCQPCSSESPGLDKHMSGPSHFSPEAKEFEPTREYGKAKLLLSPEVSKDAKNKTRCPRLTSTCMEQDNYSPPSEEKQGTCAECGTSTSQRCSNCRQVFYCKRDCQREHWKKGHKSECKPFKLEKNSTLGRYLVATRDFKAGDIIFKDEPLFVGPKQITEPICLSCYKRVDGSYRCSKCTWPMCGTVCESSPDHQPECVVGKVMGSPIDIKDFNDTNHFYEVVSPLRGLALKKRAPKKYEELLALESHFNDRVGTNVYNENQKRVVNMLKNYFMLVDFPPEDIDASDRVIHHMTGIIDVNTVEIPLEETDIIGIYPTYSMLEHSCTPNTKYKVSPLYQLTLRAAVNIRQGEHLSTIYTHMLWGTAARRDCLKSTRYFMCTCRRCADPTELGTNFSALRCPKCPLGFMMSAAPLDQLADWICTSCNSTMTGDDANDITLQLGEEVERVLANPRVKDLEDFIEKSSATIVHPNHFHLFAARHSLLQMLGREKPGLDEEAVKKKEKLCQEFLKTCTALDPGMCKLSSYAGVALYEYHLAVMARTRQGPTDQQVDKIALKKDLDTAKALLQQCIKVLQEEPSEKPEGQLRYLAEQNLQELSQWESP